MPVNVTGKSFSVTVDGGTYANGQVCFTADTSGSYTLTMIASGGCNEDTCTFTVPVVVQQAPVLACPADTSVFLCGPDTLTFDLGITDLIDSLTASAPAFIRNGQVVLPVDEPGTYNVTVTAINECGIDTCSFVVNADFNSAPSIAADGGEFVQCDFTEVCLPFSTFDPDNNIDSITTSLGYIKDTGSGGGGNLKFAGAGPRGTRTDESARQQPQVCFTPDSYGEFPITLTVYDACGETSDTTIVVSILPGDTVAIVSPPIETGFVFCGEPGQVCWPVGIAGNPTSVSVSFGELVNGALCFMPDTSGRYDVTIIADADCNSDTLTLSFDVRLADSVQVSCPVTDTSV
ncbi:MAG: hypothetical protein D6800_11050, partial [Candidatus Zixiibacteriota bacterium]